jgi:hypothetical protein
MARSTATASTGGRKIKEDEPGWDEEDGRVHPKLFLIILIFIFLRVVLLSLLRGRGMSGERRRGR